MRKETTTKSLINRATRWAEFYAQQADGRAWPAKEWAKNPIGFADTILGVRLWAFQEKFLENIRDHRHVAVAGGRKIGKDFAVGIAALWWYASFPNARVFMLAPTADQIDDILYREIRMLFARSGRCWSCKQKHPDGPLPCPHSACLVGKVHLSADEGIVADDFREIIGRTSVKASGIRGISGSRMLAIEDEASDIKEEMHDILLGNLAGADCHRVAISQPDKTTGFFFRDFHEGKAGCKTMQVSTEENPNIVEGKDIFPGLAGRQWLAERAVGWGRGSRMWTVHVEGKFPKAEQGQLFSLDLIKAMTSHLEHANDEGRLRLGVDVAGENDDGDEVAFHLIRGYRTLAAYQKRGMTPEAILEHARGMLKEAWRPGDVDDERPLIILDRAGGTGARVYDVFNAYRLRNESTDGEFALVGFQGGHPPIGRLAEAYRYNRDALFGGLLDWAKAGGQIIPDVKLEGELAAIRWADSERGKSQLVPKSEMKDRLGRSPDRLDALALSTWGEVKRVEAPPDETPAPAVPTIHEVEEEAEDRWDTYNSDYTDPRNARRR